MNEVLQKLLFKIAKAPFMGKFVGIAFRYFSWAIPVKKVYSSREIIAFYHPKQSYKNHIIILPKKVIANLQQLASDCFCEYFVKIWEAVKEISEMHPEYKDSFVLVVNGGRRQEVSQVHFHMFTEHDVVNSEWENHYVIPTISEVQITKAYVRTILHSINSLDAELNIVQRGYSFVYQFNSQENDRNCPVFHIISGKKLK